MVTREEHETRQRFRDRYGEDRPDALVQIERAVIGADWGADGYTTRRQADQLADALRLAPSVWLLDIGSGRGWPGLYLAASTGCRVVLSDVPLEGLRAAVARAATDRFAGGAVAAVAASARALPYRAGTFDAVVHADVLC
ncbi:MAG: class I SAM-dependent methyltransferase [Acidimicrobiia bacterium]|nr:class I SAM-dependent methyltransferase [Acidimicrobiia bacterium]